jgi:hypothetical protein
MHVAGGAGGEAGSYWSWHKRETLSYLSDNIFWFIADKHDPNDQLSTAVFVIPAPRPDKVEAPISSGPWESRNPLFSGFPPESTPGCLPAQA